MTPHAVSPDDPDLPAILHLIRSAFAPIEGLVHPPSSIHRLTLHHLRSHATDGALWAIASPPCATVIATPRTDCLHLGKLAITPAHRKQGLARALIDHMADHARALGLPRLRLQTRIELTENHLTFAALGFHETARTAHPGFRRATSITMERPVSTPAARG